MHALAVLLIALLVVLLVSGTVATEGEKKKGGGMKSYMKRVNEKYMEDVAKRPGALQLKSGLVIEILKTSDKPNARSPTESDSCQFTYVGTFRDGKEFDEGTVSFIPNELPKGWMETLLLMAEGDKWRVHIPYYLAFGEDGFEPRVPPYSTLVFEIEVHDIVVGEGKPVEAARMLLTESILRTNDL